MTLEEKVIDVCQLAGTALGKHQTQMQEKQAQDQSIEKLIPEVVDSLLRFGRIEASEKTACATALKNPVQVLELMKKLAAHRSAAEDASLGELVDSKGRKVTHEKKASANSGYVGRISSEKPDSWSRFEQNIGLAS